MTRIPSAVPSLQFRAAALGLLGRTDEARRAVQRLLDLVPDLTMARIRRYFEITCKNPYKKAGVREAYYEGLRRAGLPE